MDSFPSPFSPDVLTCDHLWTPIQQVVVGGRNKYAINGVNVQNNRVQDLFRSVKLNVNNPHFLIMQGRITKVLNMKPPEVSRPLSAILGSLGMPNEVERLYFGRSCRCERHQLSSFPRKVCRGALFFPRFRVVFLVVTALLCVCMVFTSEMLDTSISVIYVALAC